MRQEGLKYGAQTCSHCKLSWENTQPEQMCNIGFEKAKGCGRIVNRTSDCKDSIKEVLWENSYN